MSRRRTLAAALLLLAALAAGAWLLRDDGPRADATDDTPSPRAASDAAPLPPAGLAGRPARDDEAAGTAPPPPASPPPPIAGRRRLRLLVRHAGDAPAGTVAFSAGWRRQEHGVVNVLVPIPLVLTGPREAWADLGDARGIVQAYARSADGALGSKAGVLVPVLDGAPDVVEATLDLFAAGRVVGTVTAPDGSPVAGARVVLERGWGSFEPPPTGADGRYAIEGVAGTLSWQVEAPGFAPSSVLSVRAMPGKETSLGVVLEPSWTLVGRAADEHGRPLSGTLRAGREEAALGARGEFRFVRQPVPDDRVGLWWDDGDRAVATGAAMVPARASGEVDVGEVRLSVRWRVECALSTPRGDPVANVMVGGVDPSTKQVVWGRITNEAGRVVAEAPAGTWTFGATGHVLREPPTVTFGPAGPREPVRLVVEDAVRLAGRVTYDGSERPDLSYVTVGVLGGPASGEWARCAVDGVFALWIPRSMLGSPVLVRAGYAQFARGVAKDDGRDLDLRLSPAEAMGFRLRVVRKDGTTPVPFYDLEVRRADYSSGGYIGSVHSASGETTSWPYVPGAYRVTAVPWDGGLPATVDADLSGPAWAQVTIRLPQ